MLKVPKPSRPAAWPEHAPWPPQSRGPRVRWPRARSRRRYWKGAAPYDDPAPPAITAATERRVAERMEAHRVAAEAAMREIMDSDRPALEALASELLTTGSVTVEEPTGTLVAVLWQRRWRKSLLAVGSARAHSGSMSLLSLTREDLKDGEKLEGEIVYRLARTLADLRAAKG